MYRYKNTAQKDFCSHGGVSAVGSGRQTRLLDFASNTVTIPEQRPGWQGKNSLDSLFFCYYNKTMKIEFDKIKSSQNVIKRGLPFDFAAKLDWHRAVIWVDTRRDYGEQRWSALVPMRKRLYFVCYTWRQDRMRIISFRKANNREINKYDKIHP